VYILHYHYFKKDANGNPTTPVFKKAIGKKLCRVMDAYHAEGLDHDLTLFTPRIIDDVENTEE